MRRMQFAQFDAQLTGTIVSRRTLLYTAGAEAALDRPRHVRAASGVAWLGESLAIVQDDAHFVALVDPGTGQARAIPLPAGPDGKRLFDDTRGTKHLKLDLEACIALCEPDATRLIAFGSGSKPLRERIVVLTFDPSAQELTDLRVIDARPFYALLHESSAFSGGELNLEGAALRDDSLVLFQRGNGAPRDGRRPPNAVAELALADFRRYLEQPSAEWVPRLERVVPYDLGAADGVPFTFTDATVGADGTLIFLASAEDSSDSISDGVVHGTRVGRIDSDGSARLGPLCEEDGRPSRVKAEGIAIDLHDPARAWIVIDLDDPALPAELLEVRLPFGSEVRER